MHMTTGAARHYQSIKFQLSLRRAAPVSSPQIVIPKRSEGSQPTRLTGQNFNVRPGRCAIVGVRY
jgi:hypothetical protein